MKIDKKQHFKSTLLIGLVPALLLVFLLGGNWQSFKSARDLSHRLTINQCAATADEMLLRIDLLLQDRAKNLTLLANLWRGAPHSGRQSTFLKYANVLLAKEGTFDLVLYIDEDTIVVVTPPATRETPLTGLDIQSRPANEDLFKTVLKSIAPWDAAPTAKLTSKGGLVLWSPVFIEQQDKTQADGTVAGALYVSELVEQAITPLIANAYWLEAEVNGKRVYNSRPKGTVATPGDKPLFSHRSKSSLGLVWEIKAWPKEGGPYQKLAPNDLLRLMWQVVLSIMTSGLLGLALFGLHRMQRSRSRMRQSEQRYQTLVSSALDGILVLDFDGNILDANQASCNYLGYRRHELIRMSLEDITQPGESTDLPEKIRQIKSRGRQFFEMSYLGKDQKQVPVEVSAQLFNFGGTEAVLFMSRDITARKAAMQALATSEEWLRVTFEHAPVGLTISSRDNRFQRVNDKFCEISGYTREELSKMTYVDLVFPSERDASIKRTEEYFRELPQHSAWERRLRHKSGRGVWVRITNTPVRPRSDAEVSSIDVIEDITERRKLERQLRQSQKMESIGTLAGGIAHDFNNILGSILGYAQMAMIDQKPGSKAKSRLEQVLKAGSLAKDLVRQILTFSRRGDTKPQPVKLSPIIKETLKFLRASLPSYIDIQQDLCQETGSVMANPIQVQQVLMNLCTNAAQAMEPAGGRMRVVLREEDLNSAQAEELGLESGLNLVLAVSDQGKGIKPQHLERVFEPYFTTKQVGEGTGMGLAVVHGIVVEAEGAVTVESEPGRGSTFRVYLPRVTDSETATPGQEGQLPHGHESILLIDDDSDLLEVAADMLQHLGYRVDAHGSPLGALAAFEKAPDGYQLVIADQTMPGISGMDLLEKLLAIRPKLAVILCTGYSQSLDLERIRRSGVKSLLMKPLVLEELAPAVRTALRKS